MTAPCRLFVSLTLMTAVLSACGGEAAEAAEPSVTTSPEGPAPGATTTPAVATPEAETAPPAAPTAEAAVPELPVPASPTSWRATMGELTVDDTTVRFVSATCGALAMMPVVQAVAAGTASCTQRTDTQLSVVFESGRVMAINTSGPDAACVRAGVLRASTNATCQVQLTFGN